MVRVHPIGGGVISQPLACYFRVEIYPPKHEILHYKLQTMHYLIAVVTCYCAIYTIAGGLCILITINSSKRLSLFIASLDSLDLRNSTQGAKAKLARAASFFFGVRIRLGMNFNYLILWVRVKGQG